MRINKKILTLTKYKNIVKNFVPITLLMFNTYESFNLFRKC